MTSVDLVIRTDYDISLPDGGWVEGRCVVAGAVRITDHREVRNWDNGVPEVSILPQVQGQEMIS